MKRLPSRTYLATIHPQDAADILDAFERDEGQYYPDDDNTDVSSGGKAARIIAYFLLGSSSELLRFGPNSAYKRSARYQIEPSQRLRVLDPS